MNDKIMLRLNDTRKEPLSIVYDRLSVEFTTPLEVYKSLIKMLDPMKSDQLIGFKRHAIDMCFKLKNLHFFEDIKKGKFVLPGYEEFFKIAFEPIPFSGDFLLDLCKEHLLYSTVTIEEIDRFRLQMRPTYGVPRGFDPAYSLLNALLTLMTSGEHTARCLKNIAETYSVFYTGYSVISGTSEKEATDNLHKYFNDSMEIIDGTSDKTWGFANGE